MAAGNWVIFHRAKEFIGDGNFDLDNDSFKIALLATSWTPSATHQTWASLATDEIAASAAKNYTAGGSALTGVTWTRAAGVVTFDANDPSWSPTGATLSARYAAIYNDTQATGGDDVTDGTLCYCDLSTTGGNVSVVAGNTLTIQLAAAGIFTVS